MFFKQATLDNWLVKKSKPSTKTASPSIETASSLIETASPSTETASHSKVTASTSIETVSPSTETASLSTSINIAENCVSDKVDLDIGEWMGKSFQKTSAQKSEMLKHCWKPLKNYDFRKDAPDQNRSFIYSWLETYAPWLAYSKALRGALCVYCVLFPPNISKVQGVLGSFIVAPFTKYKKFHDACKGHASSQWHLSAKKAAQHFTSEVPVDVMMVSGHKKLIDQNRKIVSSILSTIIFCGTHDLALRGKNLDSGNGFLLSSVFITSNP